MDSVELHVPPDVAYVGLTRLIVTRAARQAGMDEVRVEDLKIAVSEATTQAILDRERRGGAEPIALTFGASGGRFEVTVHGAGEHVGVASTPIAGDWPDDGSLGVTVIEGLTDEVQLVRRDGDRVDMKVSVRLDANGGRSADR